jgi:hypothetical protein
VAGNGQVVAVLLADVDPLPGLATDDVLAGVEAPDDVLALLRCEGVVVHPDEIIHALLVLVGCSVA